MDILALLGVFFDIGGLFSRRVTVKERYEMKKRVRELQRREKKKANGELPKR